MLLITHLQHLLMGSQGVCIGAGLRSSVLGEVSSIVGSASAGLRPSSASLCQALGSCVSHPDPSVPHTAGLAAAELLDLALLGDAVVRTAEWLSGCAALMDSHFLF